MLEQDKHNLVKTKLIALNHGMTLSEYEKHLRGSAGSIALEKAVAKFKESQNEDFLS
jgi:hypothetical protein